jgi:hypothetical protein
MRKAGPIGLKIVAEFLADLDDTMFDASTMSIKRFGVLVVGMRISKIGDESKAA